MTSAGEIHVDEIRHDIACPGCEYNLRGLRGAVITCPECGHRCDIAQLVTRKWTKPWYIAPGLATLQAPAVWLGTIPLLLMFSVPLLMIDQSVRAVAFSASALLALSVWGWLLSRAWRLFGGPEGLLLSLLQHAILIGYFGGMIVSLGAPFGLFASLFLGFQFVAMLNGAALIAGVSAMVGAYIADRFTARRCIQRYLRREPSL